MKQRATKRPATSPEKSDATKDVNKGQIESKARGSHAKLAVALLLSILAIIAFYERVQMMTGFKSESVSHTSPARVDVPLEEMLAEFIQKSVTRKPWDPNKTFLEQTTDLLEPVIFTECPSNAWPALSPGEHRWSMDYLESRTTEYKMIYRAPLDRTFMYYHDDRPFAKLSGMRWDNYAYEIIDSLNASDFFKGVRDPSALWKEDKERSLLYYTEDLSSLGAQLESEAGPVDWIVKSREGGRERHVIVWIGPRGTITHAHTDVYVNHFVQIVGRKRFVLFPPSQHRNFYMFPHLHPCHRQSQIDERAPDMQRFPEFANITAYEAIVEPGSVLFLPPLWVHSVTALTPSVSMNVWIEPDWLPEMIKLSHMPFSNTWGREKKLHAARAFITLLVKRFVGSWSNLQHFMTGIMENRYRPLMRIQPHIYKDIPSLCSRVSDATPLSESEDANLERKAKEIIGKLKAVPDRGVQEIWLSDYVEDVAEWATGPEHVTSFLADFRRCPPA